MRRARGRWWRNGKRTGKKNTTSLTQRAPFARERTNNGRARDDARQTVAVQHWSQRARTPRRRPTTSHGHRHNDYYSASDGRPTCWPPTHTRSSKPNRRRRGRRRRFGFPRGVTYLLLLLFFSTRFKNVRFFFWTLNQGDVAYCTGTRYVYNFLHDYDCVLKTFADTAAEIVLEAGDTYNFLHIQCSYFPYWILIIYR